ncbi:MAG: hypothetical protein HGA23_03605 [Bacteroidales bacterium]|nr:hypothetical protein [Bacteroidales bacterium]
MKKTLLIIAVLVLLAGAAFFIVYKYIYNKPHPDYVEAETDIKIVAKRLWLDYSMNKDIADPRYTGKVIEITGSIMRVEVVEDMTIVVFAFKRGDFGDEGIRVTMLPEYSQAAKGINPFKNITIKGLCTGYNDIDVIMENGSIIGSQQ